MSKYKIADVSIEIKEDGSKMYWLTYAGLHASQGGMEFGYGSTGFESLDTLLDYYKNKYKKSEDEILKTIKEKEDSND